MGPPDNGPRDGDFVRYIDELTERVAANARATAAAPTATPTRPVAPTRSSPVSPTTTQAVTPAVALARLGAARLFTIGLFALGGLLAAIGVVANGFEFLLALGVALLVWASRRQAAQKVRA